MKSVACLLLLLSLAFAVSADRSRIPSFRRRPANCFKGDVQCSSDRDCVTSCFTRAFKCIGCPSCTEAGKIVGTCKTSEPAEPIICPACIAPICPSKCSSDRDCGLCGDAVKCQKCDTGCPGDEFGTCGRPDAPFACKAIACIQPPVPIPDPIPTPTPTPKGCKRAGCSSQLCVDASSGPIFSTCEFRPEFECLKFKECGKFGPRGSCAFKDTPKSITCEQEIKLGASVSIDGPFRTLP